MNLASSRRPASRRPLNPFEPGEGSVPLPVVARERRLLPLPVGDLPFASGRINFMA
jgi:hypothetical protein